MAAPFDIDIVDLVDDVVDDVVDNVAEVIVDGTVVEEDFPIIFEYRSLSIASIPDLGCVVDDVGFGVVVAISD